MKPAVEIKDLTKRYGSLTALDKVNLQVNRGEMFGIIGPDGAGKSTLYRILATMMRPDDGSATICGLDTVKDYRRLRSMIGYMPEKFSLYQDLSVIENLNFFASLFGVTVKENYELIAPIFNQLERFPDRKAGALSGGMKQKLALSCALIHRPEILLLDEPTTGVDAVSRTEFWEMLGHLRDMDITIIVSTSYMDEASRCDRIAMIDHGRILRIGTPDELVENIGVRIWNASAKEMFRLLSLLRDMPGVSDCYTFGATLHIVSHRDFDVNSASQILTKEGLTDVKIYPARPDIEDLFINLTKNYDSRQSN